MKHLLSIIWSIFFCNLINAQIVIKVVDEQNVGLSYASIIDEQHHIYQFTDEDGFSELTNEFQYQISIQLIGYETQKLKIEKDTDTLIIIQLKEKFIALDEVVITAKKLNKNKMKVKNAGSFQKDGSDIMAYKTKSKFGIVIDNFYDDGSTRILKSVNFKMGNLKKAKREKSGTYTIEIKIYEYKNKRIGSSPINTQPIFVAFDDLKKINYIPIEETIVIPQSGIFVSIEFPDYNGEQMIYLNMTRIDKEPKTYIIHGANQWGDLSNRKPHSFYTGQNPKFQHSFDFNMGISYYEDQ